jgi:Ser-tRNA(Ala) deacylase AlaX
MLKEYDIAEKLFCITTDGATNNRTMCKEISRRLKEENDIEWNYKEMHIHCMNHVINLAVQEFLKSIKGIATEAEEAALDSLEQDVRDNATLPEGFGLAMWKIRSITKVPHL